MKPTEFFSKANLVENGRRSKAVELGEETEKEMEEKVKGWIQVEQ